MSAMKKKDKDHPAVARDDGATDMTTEQTSDHNYGVTHSTNCPLPKKNTSSIEGKEGEDYLPVISTLKAPPNIVSNYICGGKKHPVGTWKCSEDYGFDQNQDSPIPSLQGRDSPFEDSFGKLAASIGVYSCGDVMQLADIGRKREKLISFVRSFAPLGNIQGCLPLANHKISCELPHPHSSKTMPHLHSLHWTDNAFLDDSVDRTDMLSVSSVEHQTVHETYGMKRVWAFEDIAKHRHKNDGNVAGPKDHHMVEVDAAYFVKWWGTGVWSDVWSILQKQSNDRLPDIEALLDEENWLTLPEGLRLYRLVHVPVLETEALLNQAEKDGDLPTQFFLKSLPRHHYDSTETLQNKGPLDATEVPPSQKTPLECKIANKSNDSDDLIPNLVNVTPCHTNDSEVQCVGVKCGAFGCGTYAELTDRGHSHFEETYAGEDDPALWTDNPGLELAMRGEYLGPVYVRSPNELRCIEQANLYRTPALQIVWFKSDDWKEDEYFNTCMDYSNAHQSSGWGDINVNQSKDKTRDGVNKAAAGESFTPTFGSSVTGCVAAPVEEFFENLVSKAIHEALHGKSCVTDADKPNIATIPGGGPDKGKGSDVNSAEMDKAMVPEGDNAMGKASISEAEIIEEYLTKKKSIREDVITAKLQDIAKADTGLAADKGLLGQLQYMTRLLQSNNFALDANVWKQMLRIYTRACLKGYIPSEKNVDQAHCLKESWCNIFQSVLKNDKPKFRLYIHDFMFHVLSVRQDQDIYDSIQTKAVTEEDKKPAWNPSLKKRKWEEGSNDSQGVPYQPGRGREASSKNLQAEPSWI